MEARATLEHYLQDSLLVLVIISGGILRQSVPRTTPILSPKSDGMAEALVELIKRGLRAACHDFAPVDRL